MGSTAPFHTVVIGASAGGLSALGALCRRLPRTFPWPLVIVQHLNRSENSRLAELLQRDSALRVKEAEDKDPLESGGIFLAPPNYHVLIEPTRSLALSTEGAVIFSRPSIDVLFESAASALGAGAVGILLTGANHDGADGLREIHRRGGTTMVQAPDSAEFPFMPRAALERFEPDLVAPLDAIATRLLAIAAKPNPAYR